MKTATLLQSFLLAAGLTLGGIPAVQADSAYSGNPGNGKYHHLMNDRHSSWHAPWWSSIYAGKHDPKRHAKQCNSNDRDHRHWQDGRHDGHGEGHHHRDHWQHGKHDGHGDWYDHGDRWKHGKYNGHGDGRGHKDYKKHGKRDGRDERRKGHRSRSAGIGYTGRS